MRSFLIMKNSFGLTVKWTNKQINGQINRLQLKIKYRQIQINEIIENYPLPLKYNIIQVLVTQLFPCAAFARALSAPLQFVSLVRRLAASPPTASPSDRLRLLRVTTATPYKQKDSFGISDKWLLHLPLGVYERRDSLLLPPPPLFC